MLLTAWFLGCLCRDAHFLPKVVLYLWQIIANFWILASGIVGHGQISLWTFWAVQCPCETALFGAVMGEEVGQSEFNGFCLESLLCLWSRLWKSVPHVWLLWHFLCNTVTSDVTARLNHPGQALTNWMIFIFPFLSTSYHVSCSLAITTSLIFPAYIAPLQVSCSSVGKKKNSKTIPNLTSWWTSNTTRSVTPSPAPWWSEFIRPFYDHRKIHRLPFPQRLWWISLWLFVYFLFHPHDTLDPWDLHECLIQLDIHNTQHVPARWRYSTHVKWTVVAQARASSDPSKTLTWLAGTETSEK